MTLAAPTDLSAANITDDTADLSWTDNSSSNNGYKIYLSTDGGSTWSLDADIAASSTSHSLTGLLDGEEYIALVAAYDSFHTVADAIVISPDGSTDSFASPYGIEYTDIIQGSAQIQ